MFAGFKRQTVLVVGLLLLAAVQRAASSQETVASASDQPQLRTWTDRAGTHHTEAVFVESKDGKVTLKKGDGTTIKVLLESLSDADQQYIEQQATGKPQPEKKRGATDRSVVEINTSGGTKPSRTPSPQAKDVVVTGVGTDPDKAVQNAFSQAIEQTVGVLVDAETVVKNDQLIRDQILTYSRGYVEKYEIINRWQKEGFHHAKIRAVVARDKLVKKLRAIRISVQDVPGELASRQIEFDVKNDEQAAEMLKKALAEFDMTKLTKAEIVGEPEITRNGTNATVRIKVEVSPDFGQWKTLSKNLRSVLTKVSVRHAEVVAEMSGSTLRFDFTTNVDRKALEQQSRDSGILVSLFVDDKKSSPARKSLLPNANGRQTRWDVYSVPDAIGGPINDATRGAYRLTYRLLDRDGETVSDAHARMRDHTFSTHLVPFRNDPLYSELVFPWASFDKRRWWWVGPAWFSGYPDYTTSYEDEHTFVVSQQDLRKVAKVAVFVEGDKKGPLGN